MMTLPKYAVLRVADWDQIKSTLGQHPTDNWDQAFLLDDAEVIRKQDITSGPIFHTYSSIIMSFIDLDPNMDHKTKGNLMEIADHFHVAAMQAAQWPGRRLPT